VKSWNPESVDLNLGNEVQLLGWRDHNEVRRLLAESHLLLCPSVTIDGEQEGVPNVLKEAMADWIACNRHR
jgi:colanic acid/amylovoran biosynthesis glycosyltransferase